ncbi:hypothetical protein Syun_027645 [Stephania yunnanensis]|uniref:Uncharacterized protein n=1 Tax=Stephania yunnanensis TaxID=152371 RepID=A0AAP0EGA2_9MAGN
MDLEEVGEDWGVVALDVVLLGVNFVSDQLRIDVADQTAIDNYMLGANAILEVSLAVCKAGASVKKVPLYERSVREVAELYGSEKSFIVEVQRALSGLHSTALSVETEFKHSVSDPFRLATDQRWNYDRSSLIHC